MTQATKPPTGGPAFQLAASEYGGNWPEWGMTIRDYFAAKAMQGFIANGTDGYEHFDDLAFDAYLVADAMLQARG